VDCQLMRDGCEEHDLIGILKGNIPAIQIFIDRYTHAASCKIRSGFRLFIAAIKMSAGLKTGSTGLFAGARSGTNKLKANS